METPLTGSALLDRSFLGMRHDLLDLAAAMDRIDRADGAGAAVSDPRLGKLREAARVLCGAESGRAKRVQMIFSDAVQDR